MATQTLLPFGHRLVFADIESKKDCFTNTALTPLEPATKRQRTEEEEQVLIRNKVVGPADVQLSPIAFLPTLNSNSVVRNGLGSDDLRMQLYQNIQQWEKLHQREEQLIQQAKRYIANLESPSNSIDSRSLLQQTHKMLASEIGSFMEHRNSALGALLEASSVISTSEEVKSEPAKKTPPPQLAVIQQPGRIAISNRHISPAPTVQVLNFDPKKNLTVSATLVYHDSEEEVKDLLQGSTKTIVDGNGLAMFAKLKIAELSTKHRQQSFALLLSLEDSSESKKIVSSAKTDSFQIQSRATGRSAKRRRDDEESPKYYGSASSDEDYVQQSPRERSYDQVSNEGTKAHSAFGLPEYNYVDITEFLTLPQKEAATRLGISESMLCKRFKECTRRKWPYRYVRKIDKVINMLCGHGEQPLSPEDKKKLEKLMKEREDRLQPVKIRITAHDRSTLPAVPPRSPSPIPSDSPLSEPANFNDEEQFVMETLEMLKTQRSPKDS